MITIFRRLLSALLLVCLLCQPLAGLTEEDVSLLEEDPSMSMELQEDDDAMAGEVNPEEAANDEEKYVAVSDVALKVRKGPGLEYSGVDSIPAGSQIYIIELGTEWSKVRTKRTVGYVLSKHLKNVRDYDVARGTIGAAAEKPQEADITGTESSDAVEGEFKAGFKAHAVKPTLLYEEPDERSRFQIKAPQYEELLVSHVQGDWSYVMYKNRIGYTRTDHLFKWDRIDPYAGDIPGCIVYPTLAFVDKTVDIISYKNGKEVLKTINPGSALAVELPDEEGRYKTPYWRTTGYINDEDIVYKMPVVPYDEAQPGDLISAMTTYYAVGVHTLQYQGRNWNIYLATTFISGAVVQPNEVFNVYDYMGPYRKSTGYKPAPIMSPNALWGYGGGTCQVSTTLYNTVIRLPLYVNHRKVHANVGIKYMLKGFDAAVGGGDINLIFTNTLPYPIRINFMLSDGVLTCCIFRA